MAAKALVLAPGLMCDATVWNAALAAFGARLPVQVADYGTLDSLPQHVAAAACRCFSMRARLTAKSGQLQE